MVAALVGLGLGTYKTELYLIFNLMMFHRFLLFISYNKMFKE